MQQDNCNADTTFIFTDREMLSDDENIKHLTPYECHCLFTENAWDNLKQQAGEADVDISFDNDSDVIISMTETLYKQSLHNSMEIPPITRQLDESIKAYARSQGVTPEKALSTFITLGVKQIVDNQYGFDAAVRACGFEMSGLGQIVEKLSNIEKDNPQDDIDASCDTQ